MKSWNDIYPKKTIYAMSKKKWDKWLANNENKPVKHIQQ